jgi:DNA-binding GntR family transcriptional regulator
MLEPVDNTTLQERVYRALKEAILEGHFAPGETLSSRSLAKALGTSPMPVRDALVRLRAEGGVEILPNRAARIPVFSRESIEELYDVRLNLEAHATDLATQRMTESTIADVEQSFADMERASDEMDIRGFLHANRLFHFKIYQAAQSDHLFPIIEALWLKGGPLLRPFAEGSRAKIRLHEGHDAHAKALQGLKQRNPEMARAGIVEDLENAARWFRSNPEVPTPLVTEDG